MHKLTTEIARELKESITRAIMEKLKEIKHRVLKGSKEQNRKLSKWNARI
jgi:IS605 OrfB family transposase